MTYTNEQFAELSKFEDNFRTATSTPTGWTRRIAIPDQRRIKAIYTEATGERVPYNIGCGNCLLSLLKKAGKLYFADKEEREKPVEVIPEPEFDPAPIEPAPKKKATRKTPKSAQSTTSPSKKEKEKA